MPYFYYDREYNNFCFSPDTNVTDLKEIKYGYISFWGDIYTLSPINLTSLKIQNIRDTLVLNNKIINPPCIYCQRDKERNTPIERCSPCSFSLLEPYSLSELPFENQRLEESLADTGYIRTSSRLFRQAILNS